MTAPLDEKGLEAAEVAWRASVAPTCKLMLTAAIRAYLAATPSPSMEMDAGKLLWRAEETRADLLTHHRKEAGVVGELADALASAQTALVAKDAEAKKWWLKCCETQQDLNAAESRAEAAEARVKDAMGLLDHLIGWIVHDCGAEPPFTSEQDETYTTLQKGRK